MLKPPMFPPKPIRGWAGTDLHQRLIDSPDWIVQPKGDGDRCLVFFTPQGPALWNRHGTKTKYGWLGALRAELAGWGLPAGVVLDCELLHEPQPKQDLMVFDIPSSGGPLSHRLQVLDQIFEGESFKHVFQAPLYHKPTAYEDALALGQEGVVFKQLDSQYIWQRANTGSEVNCWIKMKPSSTFE